MFPAARDILKDRSGTLAQTPFALLLQAIFVQERTLVVELRRRQLEKRISFEDGVPVGCRSNLLHETLGRFLVERGRITEPQCHEALAQSAASGEPLGEVLVRRGYLAPYDLYRAMQQNVARRILDCFTWTDATFRLHGTPEREETPLAMNPAQLILTAATTVLPFEVVAQGLTFFDAQRFARVPDPPHRPDALKMHAKDARLLSCLGVRPTFAEICAGTGLTSEEAMRRVYAFGVLGVVAFAEDVKEVPREAPPALLRPAPTVEEPAKAEPTLAPSGAAAQALANSVMEAFLKHRQQDAFELLAIPTTATVPDIRRAYFAHAERYRPALFSGELAQVADKAEELFLAGARAYATLADPEGRTLAIERKRRKAEEAKRKKGEAGADFRIRTELLDAGEQFREGQRREANAEWAQALNYYQFACDIDPTRAVYRAHLGWARFKDSPARADLALKDLAEALRGDPRCDLAHWFEGQIRVNTGDLAGAEECFRRAIKARPEEKQYTEALKAIGSARRQRG